MANGRPSRGIPQDAGTSTAVGFPLSPNFSTTDFVGGMEYTSDGKLQNFLDAIVNLGLKFKRSPKVKPAAGPPPSTKRFSPLPTDGISYDKLLEAWQEIADKSTNWSSPNFMGFPDSGNALPALGAAVLVPFLNQNLVNQDICSPAATFIEMEVVHWLRQQAGFPVLEEYHSVREIGGVLTLGGSLSIR
jgi:L-2,4-diaminobutyrate decarboxylase